MNRDILDQRDVTFDDEIAESFHYDYRLKILEIGFGGFIRNGTYHASACKLRVANWKRGQSKRNYSHKFQDLDSNFGVVSLLLSIELKCQSLVLIVNTVDNRYVEWHFESASLEVIREPQEVPPTPRFVAASSSPRVAELAGMVSGERLAWLAGCLQALLGVWMRLRPAGMSLALTPFDGDIRLTS
jgi:hypothetical protein